MRQFSRKKKMSQTKEELIGFGCTSCNVYCVNLNSTIVYEKRFEAEIIIERKWG